MSNNNFSIFDIFNHHIIRDKCIIVTIFRNISTVAYLNKYIVFYNFSCLYCINCLDQSIKLLLMCANCNKYHNFLKISYLNK